MTPGAGRHLRLVLAGLATALAFIALIGPLALGATIRQAYQNALGSALKTLPQVSVAMEHYDQGWFSSSASVELTLQPARGARSRTLGGPARPTRIRLDSHVEQGPAAWLAALPRPVLARVHTRVEWVEAPIPLPPFGIDTDLLADGGALARVHLPAGDRPARDGGFRVRNGEGNGTVRYERASQRLGLDLGLPSIELIAPGPVSTGASVGALTQPPDGADQVVLASLKGARITSDLRAWIGGLYTGTSRMEIASARVGTNLNPRGTPDGGKGQSPDTTVEGIRIQVDQVPRESLLDLRLDLTAATLNLGGQDYRDARIGLSAGPIDGNALSELIAGLRALSAGATSPAMRGLLGATLAARLLPQLAAAQPRIGIDPLVIQTPTGPVSGRLDLGLGTRSADAGRLILDPTGWLRTLTGEGELALPHAVALEWLARAGPASSEPPQAILDRWAANGWISAQNDRIASGFRLADGLLAVNGKTLPLRRSPGGL